MNTGQNLNSRQNGRANILFHVILPIYPKEMAQSTVFKYTLDGTVINYLTLVDISDIPRAIK